MNTELLYWVVVGILFLLAWMCMNLYFEASRQLDDFKTYLQRIRDTERGTQIIFDQLKTDFDSGDLAMEMKERLARRTTSRIAKQIEKNAVAQNRGFE